MNRPFWLFLGLVILTCVRLFIIGSIELSPDESYYLLWSEHPDVCYYSKGPGVAAAIWISTHLFGVSEFGVRFFSPLLSLGTSLLLFSFARRLYSESIAIWTVVLMNFLPIFQVGSVLMTIDPLSIFFGLRRCMRSGWRSNTRRRATNRTDLDPVGVFGGP